MEFRQLEYFLAVAEELSVTEAASRLAVAQSTVSSGLRALEQDLGVRLFDREPRSLRLTAVGERLLTPARTLLEDAERLRVLAGEAGTGLRGQLRIGTFSSMEQMFDLPTVLHEFRQRYPGLDVRLFASVAGSTGFADDLTRGRLDAAFYAADPVPELETVPVASAPFVALVPQGHRLSGRGSVTLAELAEHSWVDTPKGYANRTVLEGALLERRLTRRVTAEVTGIPGVPPYVAAGLGVAVIPDVVNAPGCVRLAVAEPLPPWTLTVAIRRGAGRRPAIAAFLDMVSGERP